MSDRIRKDGHHYDPTVISYRFEDIEVGDFVRLNANLLPDRLQWAKGFDWEFEYLITSLKTGHQCVYLYGGDRDWAKTYAFEVDTIDKVVRRARK